MSDSLGKPYASRKPSAQRPKNDLYNTPFSCTWELLKKETFPHTVWEPAAGNGAIAKPLIFAGYAVISGDISTGQNFLSCKEKKADTIITNSPFYLWNDFILKAKSLCVKEYVTIGRMNYFGTHDRNITGLWDHLKTVYIFDRMIDYQTPYREDGLFHLGCLVTGWFLWDFSYNGDPVIKQIDMQKYARLGAYKKIDTK